MCTETELLSHIFMNFYKACANTCDKHLPKFVMRIIYKSAVVNKRSTKIFLWVSAKIKAEKKQKRNVSIVILLLNE